MSVTQKHERKLLDALDTVVEYVQQGVEPNTAIVKTAREKELSKDYITLLTRAYNTGRTLSQLQEDSVMEKTAEFKLADESEINKLLYPEDLENTKVSFFYLSEPKYQEKKVKVSSVVNLPPMVDKVAEPYPRDAAEDNFTKLAELRLRKRNIELLRSKVSQAFDKMASSFNSLTEYFKGRYSVSPKKVASVCETIYGFKGKELIRNLIEHDSFIEKCAHDDRQPLDYTKAPMTIIADFMERQELYLNLKKAYEIEENLLKREQEEAKEKIASIRLNSVLDDEFNSDDLKKKTANLLPIFNSGLLAFGTGVRGLQSASDRSQQAVQSELVGKLDPQHHTQALNNIRAQAILSDLLINDEELTGYDPDIVIDAYNDLIQVVPEAANKKLLLQSSLKQLLAQGGLDKYDVKELAETQKIFEDVNNKYAPKPPESVPKPPSVGLGNLLPKPPSM